MGYTDHDVKKMLNAVEFALVDLDEDKADHPYTISGLELTKDFLEGLLEEGRM